MKFIKSIAIIAALCINVSAQVNKNVKNIYSFVPHYMFQQGLYFDIEKKLKDNHWLKVSPQMFFASGEKTNADNTYNELFGIGLSVSKKRYVNTEIINNNEMGIYLEYGLGYNFYNLNYLQEENNNTFQYGVTINRLSGDIRVGYQFLVKEMVSLDFYTGVGSRYSFIKSGGERKAVFNGTPFGFGYTGNVITFGFRIGVVL